MGRQSRGLSMVEIEESAQAFAPLHVGGRAPRQWRLLQKPVVEPVMSDNSVGALKRYAAR